MDDNCAVIHAAGTTPMMNYCEMWQEIWGQRYSLDKSHIPRLMLGCKNFEPKEHTILPHVNDIFYGLLQCNSA